MLYTSLQQFIKSRVPTEGSKKTYTQLTTSNKDMTKIESLELYNISVVNYLHIAAYLAYPEMSMDPRG